MATKPDPVIPPDVVAACDNYTRAVQASKNAKGAAEVKHWARAAKAYAIKDAGDRTDSPYIVAAIALCGVTRSAVVMDVKAEEMRRKVAIEPKDLPANSLSAFYELHRGAEVASLVAISDLDKKLAAKTINAVAKGIASGEMTVRSVRQAFAVFHRKRREQKRALRPVTVEREPQPPFIQNASVEELKAAIDQTVVPSGLTVPFITITPIDTTAQAIAAFLADKNFREKIATACPTKGPMWILVDLPKVTALAAAQEDKKTATPASKKSKEKAA